MLVLVSGASGFIGTALSEHLTSRGHDVVPLERGDPSRGRRTWSVEDARIDDDALDGVDAVVHLAGESIGGRWTAAKKERILRSRVEGTNLIAGAVAAAGTPVFVSGSAIGYYGSRGDTVLDEQAPRGSGFLSDVVVEWERSAAAANASTTRTVLARTALVLDEHGGSLPRMLLPFKLGLGGRIGPGDQWWAWITLADHVRALEHLLTTDLEGPVNLAAPDPVRNSDFVSALGAALGRPTVLPTPAFGIKLLLGAEFADEVLLASQRVVPTKLEGTGFDFTSADIATAMAAVLSHR